MRLYKTRRKEKMKMKKLAVLFAAAALTTVTAAGCSGGQKEKIGRAHV